MIEWKIVLLHTAVGEFYTCEIHHPSGYSPEDPVNLEGYTAEQDNFHFPYAKMVAPAGMEIWNTGIKRSTAKPRPVKFHAVQYRDETKPPAIKHTEDLEISSGGGGGEQSKSPTLLVRVFGEASKFPKGVRKRLKL